MSDLRQAIRSGLRDIKRAGAFHVPILTEDMPSPDLVLYFVLQNPLEYLREIYDSIRKNPPDVRRMLRDVFWTRVMFRPYVEAARLIYDWDDLADVEDLEAGRPVNPCHARMPLARR